MTTQLEDQPSRLGEPEKKQLLKRLIAELDDGRDLDVREEWLQEVQRRYRDIRDGTVTAVRAEEVIERGRERLRNVRGISS